MSGADRCFKQGFGFAGPSGVFKLGDISGESHESYLTTGFFDEKDNVLVFGAMDHKDFLNRNTLYSRAHRKGLNDQDADSAGIFLEIGFRTEKLILDGELKLPSVYFLSGENAFETFENFAKMLAAHNGVVKLKPTNYHYCSWYQNACYFSEDDLVEFLDGFDKVPQIRPLQTIQIDDGYCPVKGDWLEPTWRWPNTLKSGFEKIIEKGYKAGVWVGPFMVGSRSRICAEHPDWLLKDLNGKPIVEWKTVDRGEKNESNSDEETYVLDSSHPEAFEYLRKVLRTFKEWGATFYKTDFMDWGYRDSSTCSRFIGGKTSAQYFVDVLKMIREEIGEESFWLACISPFQPFIGLADGMRIGNDFTCNWSDGAAQHVIRESTSDQYFNNILWQNDPDVTYVRDVITNLTESETSLFAIWNGILGGSINTSDPLHRVSAKRKQLWGFLAPDDSFGKAKVANWDKPELSRCLYRYYSDKNTWGVYVINLENKSRDFYIDLTKLLPECKTDFCIFEWKPFESSFIGKRNDLAGKLEPHSGKLFYISDNEINNPDNMTLGGFVKK